MIHQHYTSCLHVFEQLPAISTERGLAMCFLFYFFTYTTIKYKMFCNTLINIIFISIINCCFLHSNWLRTCLLYSYSTITHDIGRKNKALWHNYAINVTEQKGGDTITFHSSNNTFQLQKLIKMIIPTNFLCWGSYFHNLWFCFHQVFKCSKAKRSPCGLVLVSNAFTRLDCATLAYVFEI